MQRGELYILSAPSGAGKTTLIHALLASELGEQGQVVFSVSHTTRAPRRAERDGIDYHFVDRAEFERMIAGGRFLEWAEVHGNLYGTSRDEIEPRLGAGVDVVLDIDVQGADAMRALFPGALTVLVLPPSFADLERRLHGRGLDGAREIARRLTASLTEIERYARFDYVIVNDDAHRAGEALSAVILAQRHRLARMRERVDEVIEDFRSALQQGGGSRPPGAGAGERAGDSLLSEQ